MIARPSTAQEVAAAIAFAREHDIEIVVQSGGHSAAGLGGADGCLVVNLSNMRGAKSIPGLARPGRTAGRSSGS